MGRSFGSNASRYSRSRARPRTMSGCIFASTNGSMIWNGTPLRLLRTFGLGVRRLLFLDGRTTPLLRVLDDSLLEFGRVARIWWWRCAARILLEGLQVAEVLLHRRVLAAALLATRHREDPAHKCDVCQSGCAHESAHVIA